MASVPPTVDTVRARNRMFMRLLAPVQHRLMHFARAMTRDRHEADDLVADTVLAALDRFEEVRDPRAFLGFLFAIASRLHRRKRLRSKFFGEYCEERALRIADHGTSPEASAEVQMLYWALAQLPERQREAVMLFEISDLTLEEIRGIQGGSLSGVKMRVVRGREALSRILGVPAVGREARGGRNRTIANGPDSDYDDISLLTITGATRNA